MLHRNTSGLEAHAQQKRESALKRTQEAITRLIENKQLVNFKTVSEESGVSRTWLYKEPEIKARINQIKNQKSTVSSSKKGAFNNLINQPIDREQIDELKTKIRRLETENYTLKNHLEVVYGMTEPQLVEKVKILQQENEVLKMQLNGSTHETNRQLEERIQSLELENQKLIKDWEPVNQLKTDLILAQQKIREYELAQDSIKPKLVSLEQQKHKLINTDLNLDIVQPRLKDIGVRLNKKLKEIIESHSKEDVQNAVSAVEEYLATGKKVKSKAG